MNKEDNDSIDAEYLLALEEGIYQSSLKAIVIKSN